MYAGPVAGAVCLSPIPRDLYRAEVPRPGMRAVRAISGSQTARGPRRVVVLHTVFGYTV
jgi:hypothetical protein